MDNKEILIKEIDIIQSCINKVEQNSFVIKGWSISIIAVVLTLFPEDLDRHFISVVLGVITLSFWLLDTFFLRVDKLYRWKYDWILQNRLDLQEYAFNMNPYESGMWLPDAGGKMRKKTCIIMLMFSPTLLVIYLPLLCLSIIVFNGIG